MPPVVPTAERPLRRDAERNRQRILDAARELFAMRGCAVSLDDIAHHADVGVGTVYRRFPDRELLVDALFEERLNELVAAFEAALADPDPWNGLVAALERFLEMQSRDRGLMQLTSGLARGGPAIARQRRRLVLLGRRILERAQADGAVRDDLAQSDLAMLKLMLGSVVDATRDVDPDAWRRSLALVLDALRADPHPPTPLPGRPLRPKQVEEALARSAGCR